MTSARTKEAGAVYVEAAIVMPIMLLVTFASAFFFLCAARQVSVQMLANNIAKDISLALRATNLTSGSYCIQTCKGVTEAPPESELDIPTYRKKMYENSDGCWKTCARDSYLLAIEGSSPLRVTVTPHHLVNWYDDQITSSHQVLSPGDFFTVRLEYPFRAVLGGGIPMFGVVPADKYLVGTAVGVMEKRG